MQAQARENLSPLPDTAQPGATGNRRAQTIPVTSAPSGPGNWLIAHPIAQYVIAFASFAAATVVNVSLADLIGYQAVALLYLLAIVVLALFLSRGPVLFGTTLTALGWAFAFAPPRYSFHISSFYDKMMLGAYFAVALTISQLTARLRVHREAVAKSKLVSESERLGRTLLNSVSHELRTPIATITGAASELRSSGPLTPVQQKLAVEIEDASTRLNRVVQSLLSAARLQTGQVRPKPDWCDIPELVRLALRDVGNRAEGRPIEVKISPGLHLAKMDFVLTEQALANLILNATVHTPTGTPIEISAQIQSDDLVFQVADRGRGLPPDQLERVFDPFHRAPNAKPGGAGLGLAIVKGFVEAQGGRVHAWNRSGGGAIFTIIIPAKESPDLPEEPT